MDMVEVAPVVNTLTSILHEAALPPQGDTVLWPPHSPSAGRARVQLMHYAFSFLVSISCSSPAVQPVLCSLPHFSAWLKRIILDAPEVRWW
jgi:hypothetical protein